MFRSRDYEFTPLPTRHIILSTIQITALKTTYRSMITASTEIDRFITQLSTLMAAEKSSETNWRTRRVATMMTIITSTGFDPTNKRNRIPFPQVNGARSSLREPTINDAILPLNRQYREPMAESTDDCESAQSRLHPSELSKVHRLQ